MADCCSVPISVSLSGNTVSVSVDRAEAIVSVSASVEGVIVPVPIAEICAAPP